jgi:hypothetical protein
VHRGNETLREESERGADSTGSSPQGMGSPQGSSGTMGTPPNTANPVDPSADSQNPR